VNASHGVLGGESVLMNQRLCPLLFSLFLFVFFFFFAVLWVFEREQRLGLWESEKPILWPNFGDLIPKTCFSAE